MSLNLAVLCFVLAEFRADVVKDDVTSKTETTDKSLNSWADDVVEAESKRGLLNVVFQLADSLIHSLKADKMLNEKGEGKPMPEVGNEESTEDIKGEPKPLISAEESTQNVKDESKPLISAEESAQDVKGEPKPLISAEESAQDVKGEPKPLITAEESTQIVKDELKRLISAEESTQNVKRETRPEMDGQVHPVGSEGFPQVT